MEAHLVLQILLGSTLSEVAHVVNNTNHSFDLCLLTVHSLFYLLCHNIFLINYEIDSIAQKSERESWISPR